MTKLASSLARNSAAAATSSGRAMRPRGTALVIIVRTSSEVEANIAVSVAPGATTFTRMPRGASSLAYVRPKDRIAALVAL